MKKAWLRSAENSCEDLNGLLIKLFAKNEKALLRSAENSCEDLNGLLVTQTQVKDHERMLV